MDVSTKTLLAVVAVMAFWMLVVYVMVMVHSVMAIFLFQLNTLLFNLL